MRLSIFVSNSKSKSINKGSLQPKAKGQASKIKSPELKFLPDLNLRPKGKVSLKEFTSKYSSKTSDEIFLLIVYYLKEELKITVTQNHIFTCLKELGKKIPQHFRQTLTNSKNSKNWIIVDDWSDIKYSTSGMNYVEHDIAKASGR